MKKVKIRLRPEDVGPALGLPEGVQVVGMYASYDPNAIYVIVASEDFPDVPPDEEAPIATFRPQAASIGRIPSGGTIVSIDPAKIIPPAPDVPF